MDKCFPRTSFGCMKGALHFEPASECKHGCRYCYAAAYSHGTSALLTSGCSDEMISIITKRRATYPANFDKELHMSISTDCLQPDEYVQEKSLIVMQAWLESGKRLSIVSKGVPHSLDMRWRIEGLFGKYPNLVSYQCTCASVDRDAQKLLEPGAPSPMERILFMREIVGAGVQRVSFRMNPLVPGINDDPEHIMATFDALVGTGVKHVAVSHMYSSPKIFAAMESAIPGFKRGPFSKEKVGLRGGCGKFLVGPTRREATYKMAIEYGAKLGFDVSICGCDNQDIEDLRDMKCGICWGSQS